MPMLATKAEVFKPFDRLTLAIVGKPKAGKSRLAATGRKPILYFDFDDRKESIAGAKDVYVLTPKDEPWPKQPTVAQEVLDAAEKLEGSLSLKNFNAEWPDQEIKTVVLDSCDSLSKFCLRFVLFANKGMRREINIGPKLQIHLPNSYDGWVSDMSMIDQLITRFMSVPKIDFIMTFHEAAEEDARSTSETPIFTGKCTVYPVRHRHVLKHFNEQWRLTRTSKIPTVQVIPNYEFEASTCLLIDKVDYPNIEDIILKHQLAEQTQQGLTKR